MFCSIHTCSLSGTSGVPITAETTLYNGLPYFYLVGLPDNIVRESKERIRAAIYSCGLTFPSRRITVNLAPAHIKKAGSAFDFPIAMSILCAQGLLPSDPDSLLSQSVLIGELSLNGELRPVPGALVMTQCALEHGFKRIVLPYQNAHEASYIDGIDIIGVHTLSEAFEFFRGFLSIQPTPYHQLTSTVPDPTPLLTLQGQPLTLRTLTIAAAGFHPLILWGPPGTGKTLAASALATLLPPLTPTEALETASIYSSIGSPIPPGRPFRTPHHTITPHALIGGGNPVHPGEITLAHHGILFLDELPEFSRFSLEALRQPLQEHHIHIGRVNQNVCFPANFLFIASMNPCPCGFHPDRNRCHCSDTQIRGYLRRLQSPLFDRIDLGIHMRTPEFDDLSPTSSATFDTLQSQIFAAHTYQKQRYAKMPFSYNSHIPPELLSEYCPLDSDGAALMRTAYEHYKLSVRGYHRILKVARTIADLAGSEHIHPSHISEALQLRAIDSLQLYT